MYDSGAERNLYVFGFWYLKLSDDTFPGCRGGQFPRQFAPHKHDAHCGNGGGSVDRENTQSSRNLSLCFEIKVFNKSGLSSRWRNAVRRIPSVSSIRASISGSFSHRPWTILDLTP